MKRVGSQAVLPFGRKERVLNRQLRQRMAGKKATRGPGRPPLKNGRVAHDVRETLKPKTPVHVTVRMSAGVPNLRTRRRFNVVKKAFVRFCNGAGFRLVHFAVMSNHAHFIVEADSKEALSGGMRKMLHSISRRLNALSVQERGGVVSTLGGAYRELKGWIGRVFADRYHAHVLATPTEMAHALRYVLDNAAKHTNTRKLIIGRDPFSSIAPRTASDDDTRESPTAVAKGFLLDRECRRLGVYVG